LRVLLRAVAAYASGGMKALNELSVRRKAVDLGITSAAAHDGAPYVGRRGSICCGPFLPWAGIWKRYQIFTANCSECRWATAPGSSSRNLIYDCFFIAGRCARCSINTARFVYFVRVVDAARHNRARAKPAPAWKRLNTATTLVFGRSIGKWP